MHRIWFLVVFALVASLTAPIGASADQLTGLEAVTVRGGTARLKGLALGSRSVHVYVDEVFAGSVSAAPDYEFEVPLTPGDHEVCAYAILSAPGGRSVLGCEKIDVDDAEAGPWIAVSSDFHVSTEGGRWPENDDRLKAFVAELNAATTRPEMLVVAGDMVDNIAVENWEFVSGDLTRWRADVDRYLEIIEDLDGIEPVHALGPGHDFGRSVSEDLANRALGPSRGYRTWRGVRVIWLDSSPSVGVVNWLDGVLAGAPGEAVLAFHVPVRSTTTEAIDETRTLPSEHPLYEVLRRHAPKIGAIINGHIHKASASHLFGIPVHLCPLIDGGSYCRVIATDDGLVVERAELRPWQ